MQNQNMGKCISLHHKKVMPKWVWETIIGLVSDGFF
jgi:hypothetical protein